QGEATGRPERREIGKERRLVARTAYGSLLYYTTSRQRAAVKENKTLLYDSLPVVPGERRNMRVKRYYTIH
ncbi:MAG: hypothetical protein Q4D62_13745, partial [Planctomycetia bacterium]|nr:hypothetical protein [Planctomycetia bacterium]